MKKTQEIKIRIEKLVKDDFIKSLLKGETISSVLVKLIKERIRKTNLDSTK